MPTDPHKDIKTLSFRISRSLWIRIGDAARRVGISSQALCTEAIEKHLDHTEDEGDTDFNGPPVRKVVGMLRAIQTPSEE